jgi:hypothetical protein
MSQSDAVSEPMKSIVFLFHLGPSKENHQKIQALIDNELKPVVARGSVPQDILAKLSEASFFRSQGEPTQTSQALEAAIEIWNKAQTKTNPDQHHP